MERGRTADQRVVGAIEIDLAAADGVRVPCGKQPIGGCPDEVALDSNPVGAGDQDAFRVVSGDDVARARHGATDGRVVRAEDVNAGAVVRNERRAVGRQPDRVPLDPLSLEGEAARMDEDPVRAVAGDEIAGTGRRSSDDLGVGVVEQDPLGAVRHGDGARRVRPDPVSEHDAFEAVAPEHDAAAVVPGDDVSRGGIVPPTRLSSESTRMPPLWLPAEPLPTALPSGASPM